jgi:hypothetical protein
MSGIGRMSSRGQSGRRHQRRPEKRESQFRHLVPPPGESFHTSAAATIRRVYAFTQPALSHPPHSRSPVPKCLAGVNHEG